MYIFKFEHEFKKLVKQGSDDLKTLDIKINVSCVYLQMLMPALAKAIQWRSCGLSSVFPVPS